MGTRQVQVPNASKFGNVRCARIDGRPISVMSFTVADGRIAAIDILSDPDRLAKLDLTGLHQP